MSKPDPKSTVLRIPISANTLVGIRIEQMNQFARYREGQLFAGYPAPLLVDLGDDLLVFTNVDLENGGCSLRFNYLDRAFDHVLGRTVRITLDDQVFRTNSDPHFFDSFLG